MNFRFLPVAAMVLATTMGAMAKAPADNSSPRPGHAPAPTKPAAATTAAPQAKAKSAPGAQGPSGTNGKNEHGQPVTKAPDTPPPAPPRNPAAAPPNPKGFTPRAPDKKSGSILDFYLAELKETLQLTPDEMAEIQACYRDDYGQVRAILNDDSLSPLQKSQKLSDLREARNDRIESLLQDVDRRHEFLRLEAKYRVALTDWMADGGG